MAKTIDIELKKAFTEFQHKMIETAQKLKLADVQIDGLKRSKQHSEIIEREVKSLEEGIKTYESVGHMFILTDVSDIVSNLKKRQETTDEKIKTLESSINYLELSWKSSENNLRDMVQQKKDHS